MKNVIKQVKSVKLLNVNLLNQLKELRNYNRKLFFCPLKKLAKLYPTFQTAVFQNKFTFCQIKPNIYA